MRTNEHGFHRSELLIAGATALIAEAVAVVLFFASAFVWIAIYATQPVTQ